MRYAAIILYLLTACFYVHAQQPSSSRSELERRRQNILESIRESQEQLAITKKDKNATMSQLRALQAKLDARMRLINNINEEMEAISGTIKTSAHEVNQLRENLEVLKAHYVQSIRYAYRNRSSYNMIAFLLSSSNYNDAVRRLKYLKRYRDYRKQQADEIRQTQVNIENKIGVLSNQKNQKDMLLSAQEQQRQQLLQETSETNKVVKELKGRKKELMADIEKNKRSAKQVERAVNALIAKEIEEQHRKALEEQRRKEEADRIATANAARSNANSYGNGPDKVTLNTGSASRSSNTNTNTNPNTHTVTTAPASNPNVTATLPTRTPVHTAAPRDLIMTPEVQALSNSFAANRGKLPWPVERGVITGYFGPHKHPIAEKVIVDNNGIDIQTSPNAQVRAVFDGQVTGVFYVDGAGQNVMIVHGAYYTVYSNLATVSIKKGDFVHTKQAIGTVGLNEENLPSLKFQIWKSKTRGGSDKLNPQQWIAQ